MCCSRGRRGKFYGMVLTKLSALHCPSVYIAEWETRYKYSHTLSVRSVMIFELRIFLLGIPSSGSSTMALIEGKKS